MPIITSITVHVAYADAQSEATITFLNDAGVDYRFIIADELRVEYVDPDGSAYLDRLLPRSPHRGYRGADRRKVGRRYAPGCAAQPGACTSRARILV